MRLRALTLKDERNDNLTEVNTSHKDKDMIQKEIIALKKIRREQNEEKKTLNIKLMNMEQLISASKQKLIRKKSMIDEQ